MAWGIDVLENPLKSVESVAMFVGLHSQSKRLAVPARSKVGEITRI